MFTAVSSTKKMRSQRATSSIPAGMQRGRFTANYHRSRISEKPVVVSIAVKGVYEEASAISFTGRIPRPMLIVSCASAPRSGSGSVAEIRAAPAEALPPSPLDGDTSGVSRLSTFHSYCYP
jgi:hypothetical protein